jgi:hypothetical protein
MKLSDIFDQLTAGEFSQLSLGGQEQGVLNEANYPQVVAHVNLALLALYRRFHLKEGRLTLKLLPDVGSYFLNSLYGESNKRATPPADQRYILDAGAPFRDDIIKLMAVVTDQKLQLPLNDRADPISCFTPRTDSLVVPKAISHQTADTPSWLRTEQLELVYRAEHPRIVVGLGLFDPTRIDIELPSSHLEALLWFVASRVNNPIGMGQEFNAGNTYAAKYERACLELENLGLDQDQQTHNTRAYQKGFC